MRSSKFLEPVRARGCGCRLVGTQLDTVNLRIAAHILRTVVEVGFLIAYRLCLGFTYEVQIAAGLIPCLL